MTRVSSVLLGLVLATGLASAGEVKIVTGTAPLQTKFDAYKLVRLRTDKVTDAKQGIVWRVREAGTGDGTKVDWASSKNVPEAVFVAPPGKYVVDVIVGTVDGSGGLKLDLDELVIEILPPGDQPKPPVPPVPPTSELTKSLQAAFNTEQLDTRESDLVKLRGAMLTAMTYCDSNSYLTKDQLAKAVNANTKSVVGTGKLQAVGTVIGKHLDTLLGTDDASLSTALRAKYKAAYEEVAKSLGEVK